MSERARQILLGSLEMIQAFDAGVEWYQPVIRDGTLAEECGTTVKSTANLMSLVERLGEPERIDVGPNSGVMVWWREQSYLATGFGIGYGGEGPSGFAAFVAAVGLDSLESARIKIFNAPQNFRGTMFARQGGDNQPGTIIRVDGSIEHRPPANGRTFELDEVRAIVGGSVEIVRVGLGRIMVVNEDGLDLCEYNAGASLRAGGTVHGDVLVCLESQVE